MTSQLSLSELVQEYIPGSNVRKIGKKEVVSFDTNDILFKQHRINALWRACNQYHLNPIAKTFLGRIRAIKFMEA